MSQLDVNSLLAEIDEAADLASVSKVARISDAKNTLQAIQADLVAFRRMLIQHPTPEVTVQELGTTLGAAIRDKVKQVRRMKKYIEELEALPDDPESEVEETVESKEVTDD